jgi:type VI secretion system protein ImpL
VQYGGQPERLYEYLKAYLMLGKPEHMNKEHLVYLVGQEWGPSNGVSHDVSTSLTQHFQALLGNDDRLAPVEINYSLVAQACSTVRRVSMGTIMYSWLRERYASNGTQGVQLDIATGVAATQVIARRSGVSLSQPLPSLFSRASFEKITGSDLPQLVDEFAKDNWVCDGDSSVGDRNKLQTQLAGKYQQEYIKEWEAVVNDLMIVTPSTVQGMADLLGVLSGPASPLKSILDVITENTRLTQPAKAEAPADTGALAKGKSYADRFTTMFRQGSGPTAPPPATPGNQVTARFQHLHRLVEGDPGKTPIEMALARLRDVETKLRGIGDEVGKEPIDKLRNDPQFGNIFLQISRDAEVLPSPVREMIEQIGSHTKRQVEDASDATLVSAYQQDVMSTCERLIAGRYPFSSSNREIPLAEFAQLFGPNGIFDEYFKRVANRIDTTTRPWRWKPGPPPLDPGMLGRLEQARAIRDTFFAGGAQPSLRFGVIIASVDADTTQFSVEIDGQKFDDKKGGAASATWPGQNAGSASVTFNDRTGVASGPRLEGPWALFRLIDDAQPRAESETRTTLTFRGRRDHVAQVVIDAVSLDNPFAKREWQNFGCGS